MINKKIIIENIHKIINSIGKVSFTLSGTSMIPTLYPGTIITIKKFNFNELKPYDIIAYKKFDTHITIHRIINIVTSDNETYIKTKGDNNEYPDSYYVYENEYIGKIELE